MSDAAKRKAKQTWAIEKPKLDNARQLRGIFYIEPDDEEFTHTIRNARRKLEIPMPAAMPCKQDQICLYCRCRRNYEDTIGRCTAQVSRRSHLCKRNKFTTPVQFDAQVYSDASSIKNSGCEGSSGKIMETLVKIAAWQLTKV